jgi:hypothetical protein
MLDGDPDGDILLTQPWYMDFLSPSDLFPLEEIRLTGAHIPQGLVDVEGDGNCLFYCFLIYLVRTKNVSISWDDDDAPVVWMRKRIRDGVDSLEEQDWFMLKYQSGKDLIESTKDRIFLPKVNYFDCLMMTSTDAHFGDPIDCLIFARLFSVVVILYNCTSNVSECMTCILSGCDDVATRVVPGIQPDQIEPGIRVLEIVRYNTDDTEDELVEEGKENPGYA